MRRFWYSQGIQAEQPVLLSGDLFHHICEVCRFDVGGRFELLPGDQKAYFCELTGRTKKNATARVLEVRDIPELARPYVHLCLSLPKFATFESVLEKCVELGVKKVRPFFSDFSFVRQASKVGPERLQRWHKILLSASQQSGRGELMELGSPVALKELLGQINRTSGAKGLFPYEGASALTVRQALEPMHKANPQEIWAFVGSEGGFSDAEVELFKGAGLQPATLGEQVLRVETACVALLSVIKYEMNLLS